MAWRKYFVSFARASGHSAFLSPFIFAHDEKSYRLAVGEAILRAEEEFVPLEDHVVFIDIGGCAKIDVADFGAVACVTADDDHKLLAVARSVIATVGLDAEVVAERAAEKNIVPGGDM